MMYQKQAGIRPMLAASGRFQSTSGTPCHVHCLQYVGIKNTVFLKPSQVSSPLCLFIFVCSNTTTRKWIKISQLVRMPNPCEHAIISQNWIRIGSMRYSDRVMACYKDTDTAFNRGGHVWVECIIWHHVYEVLVLHNHGYEAFVS